MSPMKASEVGPCGERRETDKGKRLYIATITNGALMVNIPYKG